MSVRARFERLARAGAAGAFAGGVATVAMSALMFAAKRAGWMGEMPPETITSYAFDKVGVGRPPEVQDAVASAFHIAFGAGAGALFAAVETCLEPAGPGILKGVGYGSAIWALSYAGWVPALGIMARPDRDRPGRPESMLVAHWVYGVGLTVILQRLRSNRPSQPKALVLT